MRTVTGGQNRVKKLRSSLWRVDSGDEILVFPGFQGWREDVDRSSQRERGGGLDSRRNFFEATHGFKCQSHPLGYGCGISVLRASHRRRR